MCDEASSDDSDYDKPNDPETLRGVLSFQFTLTAAAVATTTTTRIIIYSVSQKNRSGSPQVLSHNFINSQRFVIIFGMDRPYSIQF